MNKKCKKILFSVALSFHNFSLLVVKLNVQQCSMNFSAQIIAVMSFVRFFEKRQVDSEAFTVAASDGTLGDPSIQTNMEIEMEMKSTLPMVLPYRPKKISCLSPRLTLNINRGGSIDTNKLLESSIPDVYIGEF